LAIEGFVGSTARGASCNVAELRLVPHCNGTHTESVGHIVHESVPVAESLKTSLLPAWLVSLRPAAALETDESYVPDKQAHNRLITRAALMEALGTAVGAETRGIIVRTLPNDENKKWRRYGTPDVPPFFSTEAMRYLVERDIEHLLVDVPSLDRMHDEGRLTNHHLFWNLGNSRRAISTETPRHKTITEMVFVPDHVRDGLYLLDLQIPAFLSDAAPSRPMIYPLELL
jgi:kynurenine formamidase